MAMSKLLRMAVIVAKARRWCICTTAKGGATGVEMARCASGASDGRGAQMQEVQECTQARADKREGGRSSSDMMASWHW